MTKKREIIAAFDQGTTSSRTLLFDLWGNLLGSAQQEFTQYYPNAGWVEHDPQEIWKTQQQTFDEVLKQTGLNESDIACIGITNQRETTIIWDRESGVPVGPAIVWQDRRTASICEQLKLDGFADKIHKKTGLFPDAYFSGTKIRWILDQQPDLRDKANQGKLCFGTVDTWLLWKMTEGKAHATDPSNASRTMLFDINRGCWDDTLCNWLHVPKEVLPEVKSSDSLFGTFRGIPIHGVLGDQQAALFGQACFQEGQAKNTYGTGCFLLMQTGKRPTFSNHGLLSTVAWKVKDQVYYALEGSVFIGGAAIQWLRDEMDMIQFAGETDTIAANLGDTGDVYVVPAFAGLGAPHWDMYARGGIFGLTRDTGKAHIITATLQSMAYQSFDVLNAMEKDAGIQLNELRVDGGASTNNYLMQFQSDILGIPVFRPKNTETTALGAALMAGLGAGLFPDQGAIQSALEGKTFQPKMDSKLVQRKLKGWHKAVERSKAWVDEDE